MLTSQFVYSSPQPEAESVGVRAKLTAEKLKELNEYYATFLPNANYLGN